MRHSAATAYIRPAMQRRNLGVITDSMVLRLTFNEGRCTGVEYRQYGRHRYAFARHSVVLCAGAIGSPHLLQVSGIGPGDLLQNLGVPLIHELAGVGANFRDHYAVRTSRRINQAITLNERGRGLRLGLEIAKWLIARRGLLAFSPAHVGVFHRSTDHLESPDLQFVFTPASYSEGMIGHLQRFPGMTTGVWQMRPESQGYVRARTPNPDNPPIIQPNYLNALEDQQAIVAGLHWCRRFLETDALAPFRAEETLPGADVSGDEALLEFARSRGATVYHAMGTCRMGRDPLAVVDNELRVHGIDGLRVVDASIMPTMPSANINAATLMIAEKGADMILSSA
jgi:choline dehydrogenase